MNLYAKSAILALASLLLLPAGIAGDENDAEPAHFEAQLTAFPATEAAGLDVGEYVHYDCVGPGLPGTPGPHSPDPHTDTVYLQPGGATVSLTPISVFGDGVCHVDVGGPVLEHEFTGAYRVTIVCAEDTSNPGTVALDWQVHTLAGIPFSQSSSGSPCFVSGLYQVEVTVEIDPTSFLGIPFEPYGGITLELRQ